MDAVVTAVSAAFADVVTDMTPLIAVGVGIALLFWGAPKAVGFVKKLAK